MTTSLWAGYLTTACLMTILPGLNTAMVLRTSAREGPVQGSWAACGIALGCLCWGIVTSFGSGALLASWPRAFAALRLVGAAYIGWLGLVLLVRRNGALGSDDSRPEHEGGRVRPLQRGLATNLLNPKVGVFYITLIPQFLPDDEAGALASLRLAAAHVAIALLWFVLLARLAGLLSTHLTRPRIATAIDRVTGGILVTLGLNLALGQ